jgi:hypothetical protein
MHRDPTGSTGDSYSDGECGEAPSFLTQKKSRAYDGSERHCPATPPMIHRSISVGGLSRDMMPSPGDRQRHYLQQLQSDYWSSWDAGIGVARACDMSGLKF